MGLKYVLAQKFKKEVEADMLIHDYLIIVVSIMGAMMQFFGFHYEKRPCRLAKISSCISLVLVVIIIIVFHNKDKELGYACSLFILSFNVLINAVIRLISLRETYKVK